MPDWARWGQMLSVTKEMNLEISDSCVFPLLSNYYPNAWDAIAYCLAGSLLNVHPKVLNFCWALLLCVGSLKLSQVFGYVQDNSSPLLLNEV